MQMLEDGNLPLLRLLVEKSGTPVDLDVADDDGRTVRQMAVECAWPQGEEYFAGPRGGAEEVEGHAVLVLNVWWEC